ncbi:hypothetical protein, partial [Asanoa siamensis]|uniref:hypothetical protein n=1 Tax=Asanoa siamensis TaxID=926357 RepID=UPI001940DB1C
LATGCRPSLVRLRAINVNISASRQRFVTPVRFGLPPTAVVALLFEGLTNGGKARAANQSGGARIRGRPTACPVDA